MNTNKEREEKSPAVKRSDIYLAAWMAAEDALPPNSLKLIKAHDALNAAWREAGWPAPIPDSLNDATKAVEADPLASIAFDLRKKTNSVSAEEYRARNAPAVKYPKNTPNHHTLEDSQKGTKKTEVSA